MPGHMSDLKQVVREMISLDFALAPTDFTYNDRSYFVLIKRYTEAKPVGEEFALARLEFILRSDTSTSGQWAANSVGLMGDPGEIRTFFGIPYHEGGVGDALQTLYAHLGRTLFSNLRMRLTREEETLAVASLSRSEGQDPDQVYCFTVHRNPINEKTGRREQRTPFNSQKAAILRPELYGRFKHDRGISFYFSKDKSRERTDDQILRLFNKSR